MVNDIVASAPTQWVSKVQDYLVNSLAAVKVAQLNFPGVTMEYGRTIEMPYLTPGRTQTLVPGTDLTIDDTTSVSDQLTISTRLASTFYEDVTEYKQVMPKFTPEQAENAAYSINNRIDQTLINTGINGALSDNTVALGTPSADSIATNLLKAQAYLFRNGKVQYGKDKVFMMIAPEEFQLVQTAATRIGFQSADQVLNGDWQGSAYTGKLGAFDIHVTNNLPYSVNLTLATNPTANDYVQVQGVRFTFVSSLGSTAGNVLIGVNAAATQANLVAAINGASGAGSTYVEVSAVNRRNLQNSQLSIGTFSSNVATITAFGRISGTKSLTATADGFGTETGSMLCGAYGAIAGALQIAPQVYLGQEPKQVRTNYITYALFGTKVFTRASYKLSKLTFNALPL